MRNKFSEWISKGIASFKHTSRETVCPTFDLGDSYMIKTYNNMWGMPTDTQMAKLDDGRLVITGRFVQSPSWYDFRQSSHWYAVDFTNSGLFSLDAWLYSLKKDLKQTQVNGEMAWEVVDFQMEVPSQYYATTVTTSESKIPKYNLNFIERVPGTINQILNFSKDHEDLIKGLNENCNVRGNNWIAFNGEDGLFLGCKFGEHNTFIKLNKKL